MSYYQRDAIGVRWDRGHDQRVGYVVVVGCHFQSLVSSRYELKPWTIVLVLANKGRVGVQTKVRSCTLVTVPAPVHCCGNIHMPEGFPGGGVTMKLSLVPIRCTCGMS